MKAWLSSALCKDIVLAENTIITLGRGMCGIEDRRCSRQQVLLYVRSFSEDQIVAERVSNFIFPPGMFLTNVSYYLERSKSLIFMQKWQIFRVAKGQRNARSRRR